MASIWKQIAIADQAFDQNRLSQLIRELLDNGYNLTNIEINMRLCGLNTHLIACGPEIPDNAYISDDSQYYLRLSCKPMDLALKDVERCNGNYTTNLKRLSHTGLLVI
jgi:hypothetical protein